MIGDWAIWQIILEPILLLVVLALLVSLIRNIYQQIHDELCRREAVRQRQEGYLDDYQINGNRFPYPPDLYE